MTLFHLDQENGTVATITFSYHGRRFETHSPNQTLLLKIVGMSGHCGLCIITSPHFWEDESLDVVGCCEDAEIKH